MFSCSGAYWEIINVETNNNRSYLDAEKTPVVGVLRLKQTEVEA